VYVCIVEVLQSDDTAGGGDPKPTKQCADRGPRWAILVNVILTTTGVRRPQGQFPHSPWVTPITVAHADGSGILRELGQLQRKTYILTPMCACEEDMFGAPHSSHKQPYVHRAFGISTRSSRGVRPHDIRLGGCKGHLQCQLDPRTTVAR
jgi:hypothetical protein